LLFLLRPAAAIASGKELTGLAGFVETVKPLLPIPALLAILPIVWLFFRDTWRELDEDSQQKRAALLAEGRMDHRPFVALVMCAVILTMQEYYGGRAYFEQAIFPSIVKAEANHPWLHTSKYDDLWSFGWWAGTRIFGYVLPFAVWKVAFRNDSLLDLGLRTRGFFDHAWIYGLFLAVVLPAMLVVAQSPDFGAYYPFYKAAPRSWFDFLAWEAMYFAQFFALEMFFRGFWLGVLRRSFGSGAIFVMAVPYCMIHFGKPYLEACGAIVAGIALGSLSMKTKSIYQGFLVHITVAVLMDWLSLRHRHCTPLTMWPQDDSSAGLWAIAYKKCEDQDARDALARTIEHVAIPVLLVLFLIVVLFVIRARRARADRY
jgi:membrane protease YdiL (CAAX protease family)